MTAATLTYNVPILPSPYDATLTNSTQPGSSEMATGELNGTSVLNAVTYNWLHNASTANLYLEQQLGLFMPFNPASTGGSLVACPSGGVVSVKDSSTGYTQFYVALNNRPTGFADPSTDSTNFGLVNFQNLVNSAQPGESIIWTGSSAPAGYLQWPIAQTNISRTTYARLFANIGTTWGVGDGSTTFGMPWAAAGSAILHGITGIGAALLGTVQTHTHTGLDAHTHGGATGGMSANDPHQHTQYGFYTGGGGTAIDSQPNTGVTPAAAGLVSSTSIAHTHSIPASGNLGNNSGGTAGNMAAGTTIMLCVKY